ASGRAGRGPGSPSGTGRGRSGRPPPAPHDSPRTRATRRGSRGGWARLRRPGPSSARLRVYGELLTRNLVGDSSASVLGSARGHPVRGEGAAAPVVVELEEPVVVVDPLELRARRVAPVGARPDRHGLVAIHGERVVFAEVGAGLVAVARVAAGVQPCLDDLVAADGRLVRGVPAVFGAVAPQRGDVV